MELPKIRKCHHKDYKYKVGRDNRGFWSLAKTKWKQLNFGIGIYKGVFV